MASLMRKMSNEPRISPVCNDCGQQFRSAGYMGGAKVWTCACVHPALAAGCTSNAEVWEWERQHGEVQ